MIVFEVSVNGHLVRRIAAGEFGLVNVDVGWARIKQQAGSIFEEFRINTRGLTGAERDTLGWPPIPFGLGDVVTVRVVDDPDTGDPPASVMTIEELEAKREEIAAGRRKPLTGP